MPAFEYKALTDAGRERSGVVEGDTARQARQTLREQGMSPLEIRPVSEEKEKKGVRRSLGRGGMSATELALITRQIATLVRSGTPLEEALTTTARQNEKTRIKRIVTAVRARVNEGHTLESALAEFPAAFPELFRATVAAGEKSGHLDAVLDRLADYAESRQEMQQKIGMAMFYPAILTTIAILVAAGLLTYIVPQVVQVFEHIGQDLPWLTKALIAVSDTLKSYGIYIVIAIVAGSYLFARAMRNDGFKTGVHRQLLRLPMISKLIKGLNTARFARTLSILSASGVPVLDALKISAKVIPNIPMREAVMDAAANVREGASIQNSLNQSGYFPPMTLHLIASGESSGNLEDMLERAAAHQERELQSTLTAIMTLFEPLLIVFMGALVLVIVLAILLPIFELNQLVQ
ncbi:MAG: type II secretion system inner membrane protein GspF [Gammaproteobacteria bacterium]|jgi:general secretion pathway protein F|nr:type II secretion system inner membrane protein GspF [Gammaproteobacteria bacterium]